MLYAFNLAKEQGIDALAEDIKMRGVLRTPLTYSKGEIDNFLALIKNNMCNYIMAVACIALNENFGFGKVRLHRFKNAFAKATYDSVNLDYIGENYVTLEDYAAYLNSKYDLDIDASVVAVCQEHGNSNNGEYHMAKIEKVIEMLRREGYEDAAEYLEKKVS